MAKVTFKSKGFDELHNLIERKRRNLEAIGKQKSIPFSELFPDKFIRKYTKFHTFQEMFNASGIQQAEELSGEVWNRFVAANSRFSSWAEMSKTAGEEWANRKANE